MVKPINKTEISFPSNSVNEGFARAAVTAFLAQLDPTPLCTPTGIRSALCT